eukprot:TRINITY_DN14304_c0_g1_i1.p1 TRINITY_DN14304_c0_g1~~TRINITY_DN14304_c0_g1_i1.p1  ORF type:complete len:326 (+),score=34.62 TRINITY_DN14304_c0_g1_i1:88-978(+)
MPRVVTSKEKVNTVQFKEHLYATLDFQPPEGNISVCGVEGAMLEVPRRWEIAPEDPEIISEVIAKHGWSTNVIVLSSLRGYSGHCTSLLGARAGGRSDPQPSDFIPQGNMYRAEKGGTRRLLIRTKASPLPQWSAESYRAKLLADIGQKRLFTDCKIGCGDKVLACHRSVLAESSPVLRRMLESEMSEGVERHIQIKEANPRIVEAVIEFVYTGNLEIENSDIPATIALADCYQMNDLLIASSTRALEVVDEETVASIARSMRPLASKPETQILFGELLAKLQDDAGLLHAAILGL